VFFYVSLFITCVSFTEKLNNNKKRVRKICALSPIANFFLFKGFIVKRMTDEFYSGGKLTFKKDGKVPHHTKY